MDDFKNAVIIESITTSLMSGRPLSRSWGFSEFLLDKTFESILTSLFGERAFDVYSKMSEEEQVNARAYFETCGEEVAKMYKADLWEDWDDNGIFGFDLQYLFDNHRDIYEKVAENIATRAYNRYNDTIIKTILDRFLISPKDLSEAIIINVTGKHQ